jgi:putative transposase
VPAFRDHRVDLAPLAHQYGGMKADDAKELKELRRENQRLMKIVADQALDIDMLKELNRGNF